MAISTGLLSCTALVDFFGQNEPEDSNREKAYLQIHLAPSEQQPRRSDLGVLAYVEAIAGANVALRAEGGSLVKIDGTATPMCEAVSGGRILLPVLVIPDSAATECVLFADLIDAPSTAAPALDSGTNTTAETGPATPTAPRVGACANGVVLKEAARVIVGRTTVVDAATDEAATSDATPDAPSTDSGDGAVTGDASVDADAREGD